MLASVQSMFFSFALGVAVSAAVSNLFQLMSDGRSVFHVPVTSDARRLVVVGVLLLAGPHILFSAAGKSLRIGDWPAAYVAGCLALGAAWAFVLGFCTIRAFAG